MRCKTIRYRVSGTAYVNDRERGIKRSGIVEVKRLPLDFDTVMNLFVDCVNSELTGKGRIVDEVLVDSIAVVRR
jgi:hypothetical protein